MKVGIVLGWSETTPGVVKNAIEMDPADFASYSGPDDLIELTGGAWIGWTVNTNRTFSAPAPTVQPYQGWKQPLYMSQSDKLIQNTTAETSSGASQSRGSALLDPWFIDPMRLIEFRQFGVVSTGASGVTLTVRLKLAGGTIITLPLALPANMNNSYWELQGKIIGRTIGQNGTLVACMTLNGPGNASITPAPIAVDTSVANQLDLTYQWSAAAAGNKLLVLGTFLEATT